MNEPWVYSVAGYDTGRKAPGRCSKYVNGASIAGMSGYEAYIVSHNMLLAHAEAVEVFRKCDHVRREFKYPLMDHISLSNMFCCIDLI